MKTTAVFLNVVLFAVTGSSVLTEGIPKAAIFWIFTLLALLVPVLNLTVHLGFGVARRAGGTRDHHILAEAFNVVAIICNLGLAAFSVYAAIAQYPYREGNSVIPFALLLIITPIVSLAVISRGGRPGMPEQSKNIAP